MTASFSKVIETPSRPLCIVYSFLVPHHSSLSSHQTKPDDALNLFEGLARVGHLSSEYGAGGLDETEFSRAHEAQGD